MRVEQVDYGYAIKSARGAHILSYRQKSRGWQVAILTLLLVLPWGFILDHTLFFFIPLPMGFIVPISLLFSFLSARAILRSISARADAPTISVTDEYLEANGKRYDRSHIRRIYPQAPTTAQNNQPVMADNSALVGIGASGALGPGGIAAAGIQAGADGIRNSVGLVSHGVLGTLNLWSRSRGWSVWMQYGASPVRIASRLEPVHAELLSEELVRLLNSR